MNWLKFLTGLAAILVAGCAAYFSVTGLAVLFSGASLAVMIMAGSLEFAKLVSATYLKQRWKNISGVNKWYLTIAVVVLMLITSAGIFGFLSNAFQQQNIRLEQVSREVSVWQTKIDNSQTQVNSLNTQITNLQNNQDKIIGNTEINNRVLRSVDKRDAQVSKLQDKINVLQDSILSYNERINTIKNENIGLEREIGGFRFVAESFNLPLNTVVKFFIILIVFVFDPLAIALVIAFNSMISTKKEKVIVENIPQKEGDNGKFSTDNRKNSDNDGKNLQDELEKIDSKDLIGEVSKVRFTDDQLKELENYLIKKEFVQTKNEPKKYDLSGNDDFSKMAKITEEDLEKLETFINKENNTVITDTNKEVDQNTEENKDFIPSISDDFQIGPKGAYEYSEEVNNEIYTDQHTKEESEEKIEETNIEFPADQNTSQESEEKKN